MSCGGLPSGKRPDSSGKCRLCRGGGQAPDLSSPGESGRSYTSSCTGLRPPGRRIRWARRKGGRCRCRHGNVRESRGASERVSLGVDVSLSMGESLSQSVNMSLGMSKRVSLGANMSLSMGESLGLNVSLSLSMGESLGLNVSSSLSTSASASRQGLLQVCGGDMADIAVFI